MRPVASPYPPGAVIVPTGVTARYNEFWRALEQLRVPDHSLFLHTDGPSFAVNANRGIDDALSDRTTRWVWLIGDDHTFHPDLILQMLAALGEDRGTVLSPLATLKTPPFGPVFLRSEEPDVRCTWDDFVGPDGELRAQEVAVIGGAGMLLHVEALMRMGGPWFVPVQNGGSPDAGFSRAARRAGVRLVVDPHFALGHTTPVTIVPQWDPGTGWRTELQFRGQKLVVAEVNP